MSPGNTKKTAVLIVTYNHRHLIANLLERIPDTIWNTAAEVLVLDDASTDDTCAMAEAFAEKHGIRNMQIIKNEKNHGYGGNQKKGYRYCMEKGYDIVVLLHGDGQYAPEAMPGLIEPVAKGKADAVLGSRMLIPGGAIRGGMPLYKFAANKLLTLIENTVLGTSLSEFHCGYRVYDLNRLKMIPFMSNTNGFHFDSEVIFQLRLAGCRIMEHPIETHYGSEKCHVNGPQYGLNILWLSLRYALWKMRVIRDRRFDGCAKDSCSDAGEIR